ncbi:uncharacterized protein [Eurosta solidaginis]|uniref:uncharacterized protein n=1 Tax=Eurosta solidaginis TaxID=178769 RepID=UPI003531295C
MLLTRSGSNSGHVDDDGGSDDLNTTVQEQNVIEQQQQSPLELQISAMVKQMAELQNTVAQLASMSNNAATGLRLGEGNSSTGENDIIRENESIAETLASLNRVLSSSSGQGAVKKLYDLPEFDGKPEDWPMFRESFIMTTQEYGYNERQNMIRLQKAIKGKAREVVECLLIHSNNVPKVIDVLGERFGRPEQLVKSQITRVRSCAPIPENRLDMLVPFATKVQNVTTFLEAAGCEHLLANPTLMEELLFKLPTSRRLEWTRHAINITPKATICHFSEWIQELARVVNITCLNSTQETRPVQRSNEGRMKFFHVGTNGKQAVSCELCTEAHHIEECSQFKTMDVESRWKVVRNRRLCFNCLRRGHRSNMCGKEQQCSAPNCAKKVHVLLHADEQRIAGGVQRQDTTRQPVFTNAVATQENLNILFKILPVKLYANGREVVYYAFIDEGSAVSLMNRRLANQLALIGNKEKLTLQWFGNNAVTQTVFNSNIQISGLDANARRFCMKNVKVVEHLQLPKQTLNKSELQWKHRFSKQLPIAEYDAAIPELLIGLDNAHLGVAKRVIADGRRGPTDVLTKLGWVLYGPSHVQQPSGKYHSLFAHKSGESKLEQLVENFIVNDAMEASGAHAHVESAADDKAKHLLNTTTVRKGQRYETGLLWKNSGTP